MSLAVRTWLLADKYNIPALQDDAMLCLLFEHSLGGDHPTSDATHADDDEYIINHAPSRSKPYIVAMHDLVCVIEDEAPDDPNSVWQQDCINDPRVLREVVTLTAKFQHAREGSCVIMSGRD